MHPHPHPCTGFVFRVLAPGGRFVVSFSNRMFSPKAIKIWRESNDSAHVWAVAAFFHYSCPNPHGAAGAGCGWEDLTVLDLSPDSDGREGDPLFVLQATKS